MDSCKMYRKQAYIGFAVYTAVALVAMWVGCEISVG